MATKEKTAGSEKPEDKIDGAKRAAVLLLHLDEPTAIEVFRSLSPIEMRLISRASREVRDVNLDEVEEILSGFLGDIDPTRAKLKSGAAYVNQLAIKTLGEEKAREMIEESEYVVGLPDTLAEVDAKTLTSLLAKEHPQTIALILAHSEPKRAAEVVCSLPEEQQLEVVQRLAALDAVSPEVVKLVEDTLIGEIQNMGKGATRKVGGIQVVADVMNQMEKSRSESLMERLQESQSDLAEEIRGKMFVFEDLIYVNNRGMQTLLKSIDRDTLVLALKAADEQIKQHIFRNISQRAAEMIMEDMETRGAVRLSEVEGAQAEVVRIALSLAQSGVVEIDKGGGEDALVG